VTWYLSFREAGYTGMVYNVILSDPNTPPFDERLIVKVVRLFRPKRRWA
jgi:hypothetical protein